MVLYRTYRTRSHFVKRTFSGLPKAFPPACVAHATDPRDGPRGEAAYPPDSRIVGPLIREPYTWERRAFHDGNREAGRQVFSVGDRGCLPMGSVHHGSVF